MRFLARLMLIACLTVIAAGCLMRVFDFRQQPDYGEGTLLAMVERMESEPISPDWLRGPIYTVTSYGPGYYWAVRAASSVLPWPRSLLPGRLVSLSATLATAALIALAVRRSTQSVELALLAAMIYLASPVVHAWGTVYRVDPLAVLLATGGYLLIDRPGAGWLGSAAAVAAGSLVKQTVALSAAPLFVYLLLQRRYRQAAGFAVAVVALGATAWGVLNLATGGFFFATSVRGNLNAMSLRHGFWSGYDFLCTPLAIAAVATVTYLLVRQPRRLASSVYLIGFLVSLLIGGVLSCKEGSAPIYFLEACALGAIVVGCEGLPLFWSLHPGRALMAAVLLALVLAATEIRYLRQHGLVFDREPYGGDLVSARLRARPGTGVLADGQYLPAVLHAGLTPLMNDPFFFRLLSDNGGWRPDGVVQALERGDVPYVVLKRPVENHRQQVGTMSQKWPAPILDAIQRYYRLDWSNDDLFLYKHRSAR